MSSKQSVTVIGLGPMGQAMVGAFLDHGHEVTVWNRTASRADGLVERGAVRAASIGEALAANELVIVSLTDYDAMYAVLAPATRALSGRVLVNLSSDTPHKTRAGARWVAEHGGFQIAGGSRCRRRALDDPSRPRSTVVPEHCSRHTVPPSKC